MHPALAVSKTGLDAQQTQITVISNNLANTNTVGFKKSRANFEDLLYQKIFQPGAQSSLNTVLPTGLMLGTGVRTVSTQKIFTDASISNTGNPLDLAINGRGFFEIQLPDGTSAYTRAGNFQMDSQGQLVMPNGYVLQPNITIPSPALSISIGADGTVNVLQPGSATPTQVGQITLSDFVNPAGLEPIGNNLFKETGASGAPTVGQAAQNGMGLMQASSLESSNVNVVEELVNMIQTQRSYEMNAKAIETVDGMLQFISQTL